MASHAAALGINAFAYVYARHHAHDDSYSFGTGKVNTLGGFTGAVLLAGFAFLMASESVQRLISPVSIAFNQAIFVAVLGLIVNGISMLVLGHGHDHDHNEEGGPDPEHEHHHIEARHDAHDHNLASAYLHVLADALTSLLAIVALLAAKYLDLTFMDPLMGIVGAILVARWSLGLLRSTAAVLLDRTAPVKICEAVRKSIEAVDDNRIVDLHVWCIGLGMYAAVVVVVSPFARPPTHYKSLIPSNLGIVHTSVEVHAAEG
jgi:cation diffusion facilitator family transporter